MLSKVRPIISFLILLCFAACKSSGSSSDDSNSGSDIFSSAGGEIKGENITVTVPAGSFDDEEVTCEVDENVQVSDLPDGAEFLYAATLNCSASQVSNSDVGYQVTLQANRVDASLITAQGKQIYVYVKNSELDPASRSDGDTQWLPLIDDYDSDFATITFSRWAHGTEATFVLAAHDPYPVYVFNPDSERSKQASQNFKVGDSNQWGERSWAIICVGDFAASQDKCEELANKIIPHLRTAATLYYDQANFKGALLKYTTLQVLKRRASIVVSDEIDNAVNVNHVYLVGSNFCSSADTASMGCYQISDATLNIAESGINVTERTNTFAHEIFHAIHAYYNPRILNGAGGDWLIESWASLAEAWVIHEADASAVMSHHYEGGERDWEFPLDSSAETDAYETLEFFAYVGSGSISYIKDLMKYLQTNNLDQSYASVDEALTSVLSDGLANYYVNMIKDLEPPETMHAVEIIDTISTGYALKPMSSLFLNFTHQTDMCMRISLPDDGAEYDTSATEFVLPQVRAAIVGGAEIAVGQYVTVSSNDLRVILVDFDTQRDSESSIPFPVDVALVECESNGDSGLGDQEDGSMILSSGGNNWLHYFELALPLRDENAIEVVGSEGECEILDATDHLVDYGALIEGHVAYYEPEDLGCDPDGFECEFNLDPGEWRMSLDLCDDIIFAGPESINAHSGECYWRRWNIIVYDINDNAFHGHMADLDSNGYTLDLCYF